MDLISGEDSDHGDLNPHDKTLEEVNNMVGFRLSENTAKNLNMAIDKVMITSDDADGYCTFYAILNGIYAKTFDGTSKVTEEHFARTLTNIYPILQIKAVLAKVSKKLNALRHVATYMTIKKWRIVMKVFIQSLFSYCPLV